MQAVMQVASAPAHMARTALQDVELEGAPELLQPPTPPHLVRADELSVTAPARADPDPDAVPLPDPADRHRAGSPIESGAKVNDHVVVVAVGVGDGRRAARRCTSSRCPSRSTTTWSESPGCSAPVNSWNRDE